MGELSKQNDEWQRRATAAAIAAARQLVLGDAAVIPMNTPVGRISDVEWGWLVASAIFAWIATRAEQATAEGLDVEQTVRMAMVDPNPWDTGAIITILPKLADVTGIDWTQPLAEWPRETMIAFLLTALDLVRDAMVARDLSGGVTNQTAAFPDDVIPF